MENITRHEVIIKIQENGPYRVSGGPKLTTKIPVENEEGERIAWQDGQDYPGKKIFNLCRCGHSNKKPYCDSTHTKIKFNSELKADRDKSELRRKVYEGAGITMADNESLCAGYAYCDRLGGVWSEMEFTNDTEVRKRVENQISLCPSGRLQYFLENNNEPEEKYYEPTIAVIPDGPLWVLGNIPVEAPDGVTYEIRNRQLLCRCGHSNNKPFCDGTHSSIGFKDS